MMNASTLNSSARGRALARISSVVSATSSSKTAATSPSSSSDMGAHGTSANSSAAGEARAGVAAAAIIPVRNGGAGEACSSPVPANTVRWVTAGGRGIPAAGSPGPAEPKRGIRILGDMNRSLQSKPESTAKGAPIKGFSDCGLAVLRSGGLAVWRSCGLAVWRLIHTPAPHDRQTARPQDRQTARLPPSKCYARTEVKIASWSRLEVAARIADRIHHDRAVIALVGQIVERDERREGGAGDLQIEDRASVDQVDG